MLLIALRSWCGSHVPSVQSDTRLYEIGSGHFNIVNMQAKGAGTSYKMKWRPNYPSPTNEARTTRGIGLFANNLAGERHSRHSFLKGLTSYVIEKSYVLCHAKFESLDPSAVTD